ncbi:MAG: UDP-N-acetylglucosamine 2-epimerase, partial [Candidatus Omnitrophica bacterium]|nr:UDP-N-acetylglucosamine 2-epimerase [Candidatus Omnitrophota bacterium]
KIFFVGNVMIDSLLKNIEKAKKSDILDRLNIKKQEYLLATLHRPSNVDNKQGLSKIFEALEVIHRQIKIVYPVHPRTRKNIENFEMDKRFSFLKSLDVSSGNDNFLFIDSLGYLDFMMLMSQAKFILTDSGGIQEESTVLGVPCLTLRNNTERPETIDVGTNILVGTDNSKIIEESLKIINGDKKTGGIPSLWDGHAAKRIVDILIEKNKKGRD